MEIRAVLGMHGPECARHAFNGRHLRALGVRQAGETRAVTLHAVKPFGPLIYHLRSPFSAILWRQGNRRCSKLNTLTKSVPYFGGCSSPFSQPVA
jgi:hypothetical protein